MQRNGLFNLNLWLEKKLSFPGCTNKQLQGNITVFENHISLVISPILFIAIPLLVFAPQLTIYIHYMFAIGCLYFLSLVLQLIFPRPYMVIHVCISTTMYLMMFYTIFRLGGIPTSGGLIFGGILNVLATIPRQRTWLPVSMFILFCALVIILLVINPIRAENTISTNPITATDKD